MDWGPATSKFALAHLNSRKQSSTAMARSSAAKLHEDGDSSITTSFPVFLMEFVIRSRSRGTMVLGSMTSAEIPCSARTSAAFDSQSTMRDMAMMVRSLPSRRSGLAKRNQIFLFRNDPWSYRETCAQ